MAIETIEEAKYYQVKKQEAAAKLLAEGSEMIMLLLRRAFTEGYRAKERHKQKEGG